VTVKKSIIVPIFQTKCKETGLIGSIYIREDYIHQGIFNTITKTLLHFMPDGMMEERIVK